MNNFFPEKQKARVQKTEGIKDFSGLYSTESFKIITDFFLKQSRRTLLCLSSIE